jgi:hypothetical protein
VEGRKTSISRKSDYTRTYQDASGLLKKNVILKVRDHIEKYVNKVF